jgi:ADP-ribose pyrophosphatase
MSDASFDRRFPRIELELLEDLSPRDDGGFMRFVRRRMRARYPDGTVSAPFVYDEVDRKNLDAVVMAAHFLAADGVRHVFLRSALRPPAFFRVLPPVQAAAGRGQLWEVPAGLVEADEQTPGGLAHAAARELAEELGVEVSLQALAPLGPSLYPSPGVIGERLSFFEVTVDPTTRGEPSLDGSALEHFGKVVSLPLDEALELCRSGELEDMKTEIILRRLRERFP